MILLMMILKKLGVFSVAKIYAFIMAVLGFVVGLFYSFFGALALTLEETQGTALGLSTTLGLAALVVIPVVYGIMGFVIGALGAFLYNIASKYLGGIELDIEKK